jgi:anti-sigma regulatory factor (Ser/Thr protein kinase)
VPGTVKAGSRLDIRETLVVENEPLEVGRAANWLDSLIGEAVCPPRMLAALQVALEEALTNIMLYAYRDLETHKIEIRFSADASAATLELFDDGFPFDPTQHEPPPAAASVEDRPGGLGLVFMRRLMDDITYQRMDDRNHLTLRKSVPH